VNISEANDVNILLSWALGYREKFGNRTDEQASVMAQEAASRLADRATARLMAGLSGAEVAAAWAHVEAGPWRDGGQ
jgi:hypothetical protein